MIIKILKSFKTPIEWNTKSCLWLFFLMFPILAMSQVVITVDQIVSDKISPALSGTVSDPKLKVRIYIAEENHQAIVEPNGNWNIPEGTFASLKEGEFDVLALALDADEELARDASQSELKIKLAKIDFSLDKTLFNSSTPSLSGKISDVEAKLELEINGLKLGCQVNANGTWLLDSNVFNSNSLSEGYYLAKFKASQITGNELFFQESLLVDVTNPMSVSLMPNETLVSKTPVFFLSFTEAVYPGEGKLSLYNKSNNQLIQHIETSNSKLKGWGSANLEFTLDAQLPENSEIYLIVDNRFAKDGAGNFYGGINVSDSWCFTTLSNDGAFIKKIESTSSSPLLTNAFLELIVTFSESVSLRGGNINFNLETGATDVVLSHGPFENKDSIMLSYVIENGNFSPELEITTAFLQNGATLTTHNGSKNVAINMDEENRLSKYSSIRVDGVPLETQLISPQLGAAAFHGGVTYYSNKDLSAGTLTWISDEDIDGNPLETYEWTRVLEEEELKAGIHYDVGIEKELPYGRIYNLIFSAYDFNQLSVTLGWTQISMLADIKEIEIAPSSGRFPMGEPLTFRAFPHSLNSQGQDTIITEPLENVEWVLNGPGELNNGYFKSTGLGDVKIIANYGDISAEANITVYQAELAAPTNISEYFSVGEYLQIKYTESAKENYPTRVNIIAAENLPEGIEPFGQGLQFNSNEGALEEIRFNLPPGQIIPSQLLSYASAGDGVWKKVDSDIENGWIAIKVEDNNYKQFVNGVDTIVPSVKVLNGSIEAVEGKPVNFAYIAQDNIDNPRVEIELCIGGMEDVYRETISYNSGKSMSWEIPAQFISKRGLNFTLKMTDGHTTSSTEPIAVEVIGTKDWAPLQKLQPDVYQMFSIPANVQENKVENLLTPLWGKSDRSLWRLYQYNSSFIEIFEGSRILPGKAYWVNMKGDVPELLLKANSYKTHNLKGNFTVSLHEGWNTISNPYSYPIPLKALADSNNLPELIVYQGKLDSFEKLNVSDSLYPWKGYIIWNGEEDAAWADELVIPWHWGNTVLSQGKLSTVKTDKTYRANLKLKGFDNSLSFGTFISNDRLQDRLSISLPTFGKNSQIFWSAKDELSRYQMELAAHNDKGNSWLLRIQSPSETNMEMLLNLESPLPQGFEASAYHPMTGVVQKFDNGKISFAPSGKNLQTEEYVIVIGTPEFSKELFESWDVGQLTLELKPNFPNPFSSFTQFSVSIPSWVYFNELEVRLEIYKLNGDKVKTLHKGKISSGNQLFSWDGTDGLGRPLPSGGYLGLLSLPGHKNRSFKMVLSR